MAVGILIKIGDFKGESKHRTYMEHIEVLGWSWALSNNGTMDQEGGGRSGKANVHDLAEFKRVAGLKLENWA